MKRPIHRLIFVNTAIQMFPHLSQSSLVNIQNDSLTNKYTHQVTFNILAKKTNILPIFYRLIDKNGNNIYIPTYDI